MKHGGQITLVALIGLLALACGGGGAAIPSGLGELIQALASAIPSVDANAGETGDAPGPPPTTITGTLTSALHDNVGDATDGLTKDTTFTVTVHLKIDPSATADDRSFGTVGYIDDGSTWSYVGTYHEWTTADQCQFAADNTTDYNGNGGFSSADQKRAINATTRDDSDIGWNLDFDAEVTDAPGYTVAKDQGVDCHTEEGMDTDGPAIRCQAPWTSTTTFLFTGKCDEGSSTGGLTLTGTLTGQ